MRYKPGISRLSGMQLFTLTIAVLFSSHSVLADVGPNWIEQFGITWTFDKNISIDGAGNTYRYGTFANGDYWVVGPVTIVGINPPSTEIGGRIKNGAMINPNPLDGKVGYDNKASYAHGMYDHSLNVAFQVNKANPLNINPSSSLISTISFDAPDQWPQLKTAAILTVLDSVPPAGSFRPAYCGNDKTIRFNEGDLDYSILSELSPVATVPSLATLERKVERPWLNHVYNPYFGRFQPKDNMRAYGRDISDDDGQISLGLHLDWGEDNNALKRNLYVGFVQVGIDNYGAAKNGMTWDSNGAIFCGSKWPILFAGLALDKNSNNLWASEMANIGYVSSANFQEDLDTHYTTDSLIYSKPYPLNPYRLDLVTDQGSVTITAEDPCTVHGVGTTWDPDTWAKVLPGYWFGVEDDSRTNDPEGHCYQIGTVDYGNQTLTLKIPFSDNVPKAYEDAPKTEVSYKIAPTLVVGHGSPGKLPESLGADYREFTLDDLGLPIWYLESLLPPVDIGAAPQIDKIYEPTNAGAWQGFVLAALITPGARAAWNHKALFDYEDRFMEEALDIWGEGHYCRGWSDFCEDMWDAYRANYGPIWPNQSGNPILDPIGNKPIGEDELLSFTVNATDPEGNPITYSVQNLPAGATFTGQTFSWTPSHSEAGEHQVTFVASDGQYQDSETITITVGYAPVLAAIGPQSVDENDTLAFTVSATDDDENIITYSTGNLPNGADFDINTQTFDWTPASGQAGTYSVTFNATDGVYTDSETILITVNKSPSADADAVYSKTDASSFNGVDSFVQIPTSGMSAGGGTIALSAYAEDLSVSRYLFGHTVGSWSNRIQLYIRDGNLGLGLGDSHTKHTNIASLQPRRWYHIVLTWNGAGYAVYLDGVRQATGTYSGLTDLSAIADIGNTGNPSFRDQEAFSGVIDDVRIYNRALNADEVLELYNSGSDDPTHSEALTTSSSANGSVTTAGESGPYNYDYGTNAAIEATPSANYHFVNWTGSGVTAGKVANPSSASTTITMDGNYSVQANFAIGTFTVDYAAGLNGSLTGDAAQVIDYGSDATAITAVPDTGYHFVNWSDASTDNPRTDTIVTAVISATAVFEQDTPTQSGPVAWYKFDEGYGNSAQDSSGIGNTGALAGAVWTTEDGLSFDGTDDYVEVPDSDSLDIQNEITLSLWVKLNAYDTDWPKLIIKPYQSYAAPWELYSLDLGRYGNTPRMLISDGILGGNSAMAANNDYNISLGEWHHIAGTYDGSIMSVYVDGNIIATQLANFQIGTNDTPLSIGGRLGVNGLNGFIDDVQIYNRSLTSAEVTELYKLNTLKGRWKLDTYSGLNSPDSSQNDNTATLLNGPLWTGAGELKLDGIDDYVDCGSGASSNLTGDLTVTAWICPESFGAGGLGRIVDKGDVNSGFAFYVRESTRGIAYLTYGGDFVNSNTEVVDLAKWQHVAVTFSNTSHTVAFYVNGAAAGGGNYQTNPNGSANAPLIIGNRAALDRGFEGMLSDVRIYSRTLADDEISAIYRTYEVKENKYLCFEVSAADSDGSVLNYIVQNPQTLPAGATFTDNVLTWRPRYNQAGSREITFEVPGQPVLTQSVPMVVENVTPTSWYRSWLESLNKY